MTSCPQFLLARPPFSPCFVLDEERLLANAAILGEIQKTTGAKILLALKAFAAWDTFPLLSRAFSGPLWGVCASSTYEARLGREKFGGEVHAFAAAWNEAEIKELLGFCDHLVFNSFEQWHRFRPIIQAWNNSAPRPIHCGLRLNPEHSEGAPAIYNPCSPASRLGIRAQAMQNRGLKDLAGISGFHFHTLCEQDAEALARTLEAFEEKFGAFLPGAQWLNFGGGHHITRDGYNLELLKNCLLKWRARYDAQIYLEPGEAVALNAGWLTARVLDIVEADMPVAILDVSAACHMPDVLEMPYRPDLFYNSSPNSAIPQPARAGETSHGVWTCRVAGKSCLAGDVIGEYSFSRQLGIGDPLVFGDMAIYSMVKTTTFNGLRLPSIGIYENHASGRRLRIIREFGYEDFLGRLS